MRKNYPKNRKSVLDNYDRIYVHAPEYADILKFIYPDRKLIYINTAAAPDAKVVKMVRSVGEMFS
jgi:hypothetical protein